MDRLKDFAAALPSLVLGQPVNWPYRLKDFAAALPSLVLGQPVNWPCSVQRLHCPPNPYLSTCWMVQRLTSRSLASSRWLTPFDRSTRM